MINVPCESKRNAIINGIDNDSDYGDDYDNGYDNDHDNDNDSDTENDNDNDKNNDDNNDVERCHTAGFCTLEPCIFCVEPSRTNAPGILKSRRA